MKCFLPNLCANEASHPRPLLRCKILFTIIFTFSCFPSFSFVFVFFLLPFSRSGVHANSTDDREVVLYCLFSSSDTFSQHSLGFFSSLLGTYSLWQDLEIKTVHLVLCSFSLSLPPCMLKCHWKCLWKTWDISLICAQESERIFFLFFINNSLSHVVNHYFPFNSHLFLIFSPLFPNECGSAFLFVFWSLNCFMSYLSYNTILPLYLVPSTVASFIFCTKCSFIIQDFFFIIVRLR